MLIEKLPLIGIVVAASLLSVFVLATAHGVRSLDQVSIAWRVVMTPISYVMYLWQTIWPARLAVIYPHPAMIAGSAIGDYVWPALGATVLLAAVTAACIAAARRRPYLIVGWLWYLIALVPVIGIFQIGHQSHADRFSYLPLIGIYIMVAWGLRDLAVARPGLRVPAVAAALLALTALSAASWRQIATWHDSNALFEHAVAVTTNNYFAHQTLAANLLDQNRLAEARPHLDEALRVRPESGYAHEQLGMLLERQGDRTAAAEHYQRAIEVSTLSQFARINLANMRLADGRYDEAVTLLTAAAEFNPGDGRVQTSLGTALLQQQKFAEAIPYLERAATLTPNSAQAQNNLGVALAKTGRYDAAAAAFERTLALNPNHPNAGKSLEWVRAQQAGGNSE